jgi:hypothetical protein
VNDLEAYLSYCRSDGRVLEGYSLEEAKMDIDFRGIEYVRRYPNEKVECCMKNHQLGINEEGQLVACCAVTSKHKEYNMGDILTMTKEDIFRLQRSAPICKECEKYNYSILYSGSKIYGKRLAELRRKVM